MIFTTKVSVFLISVFMTLPASSAEVADLSVQRNKGPVETVVGSYSINDPILGDKTGSLLLTKTHFQFFYISGNFVYNAINIPLDLNGSDFETTYKGSMGLTHRTHQYQVSLTEFIEREISTAKRRMSVETKLLKFENGRIEYRFTRVYYKRRYVFFGPWLEDKSSFDGRENSWDITWSMKKISSTPYSYKQLKKIAESAPETYAQIKDGVQANVLSDAIRGRGNIPLSSLIQDPERSEREVVKNISPISAKIYDFESLRAQRCIRTLEDI